MTRTSQRFISIGFRNRDYLQVPVALAEGGLLDKHLMDAYAGHNDIAQRFMNSPRSAEGLAPELVETVPRAAFAQLPLRLPKVGILRHRLNQRVLNTSLQLFQRRALDLMEKSDSGLVAYSCYDLCHVRARFSDRPLMLFQYHPHPSYYASNVLPVLLSKGHDLLDDPEYTHPYAYLGARDSWTAANKVLVASTTTFRSLVTAGCPPERISIHPYGCPAPTATAEPLRGLLRVLYVGQALARKGINDLLEAWKLLSPEITRRSTLELVISSGNRAVSEAVRNLDGISVSPYLARPALDEKMRQADVFVLPSLMEGFGLVLGEAFSAGCICVATTATGLPDLDPAGNASFLASPGNVFSIASALTEALTLVERNRGEARARAHEIAVANTWARFREGVRRAAETI